MMRLPRVRFTVRRMMLAVAAVGVALGLLAALRHRAEELAQLSKAHFEAANRLHPPRQHGPVPLADWHARLGEKYQAAANRPWLPVTDPPPPE